METPIVNLSKSDYETVYEPAEDSYILMDALQDDIEILERMKSIMCLEIGSGSGIVITALALKLKEYNPGYYLAVDINPNACKCTKRVSRDNLVDIDVIQMDLLNNIIYDNIFNIILFNPPYVVTDSEEVIENKLITKTWAGGINGREVMEKVFPTIPKLLSNIGMFYLVVIKENDPHDIIKLFKNFDMIGVIVKERRTIGEHLYVIRFTKNTN